MQLREEDQTAQEPSSDDDDEPDEAAVKQRDREMNNALLSARGQLEWNQRSRTMTQKSLEGRRWEPGMM